jgi:hypothetical protein
VRFLVILLAVLLLLSSCGLEEIPVLQPPTQVYPQADPLTPVFTIRSTTVNGSISEPEFRGYELYYKFYPDQNVETNLSSATEYDLRTKYYFKPICSQTDAVNGIPPYDPNSNFHINKPLIFVQPFDRGTSFDITIDFNIYAQYVQPVVKYNGVAVPLFIRRNVGVSDANIEDPIGTYTNQPKFFWQPDASYQTYASSNYDVQSIYGTVMNPATGTEEAYLAMYALSYGQKDLTTDLYSQPVYLGFVEINLNQ